MITAVILAGILVLGAMLLLGRSAETVDEDGRPADRELARLLVKLELRTRAVVAGHYVKADDERRAWLAHNLLLPAAVADQVFHEVVPTSTEGRAWVKMIVDEPRNPNNVGDTVTSAMLAELREGRLNAERTADGVYYYGEPITAAKSCLACHGAPKGEPDPFFPMYRKNGWEEGQVVGAVIARVAG